MDKLIQAFPSNIIEALAIAKQQSFKAVEKKIKNIVICGMGGSGIGGKLVASWVQDEINVPIQIVQDYNAPAFISENTLFIASSYSGNTEETLVCLNQAHLKGAHIIGVCSGGELQSFCANNNYDYVVVPGGNPPRTALAFSVVQLLNILENLGLISPESLKSIESSVSLITDHEAEIKSEAKHLSNYIGNEVAIFYAGAKYEPVAVRARQQFNENAKMLCWHHVIPEMNHNELVGWGAGDNRFRTVLFNTHDLIRRNQKRFEITHDVIEKKAPVHIVNAKGEDIIQRSIYLIHLVDWASYYSAVDRSVDPIEIEVIDFLKTELANFS